MTPEGDFARDPLLPDVPNVPEVYQQLHGRPVPQDIVFKAYKTIIASRALSNVLWVFKDAPEEALSELHDAINKMIADPEFTAGLDEAVGGNKPATGEQIQTPLNAVLNPDPEVVTWIKDFLVRKFDITL
jgi:hypothetical protein